MNLGSSPNLLFGHFLRGPDTSQAKKGSFRSTHFRFSHSTYILLGFHSDSGIRSPVWTALGRSFELKPKHSCNWNKDWHFNSLQNLVTEFSAESWATFWTEVQISLHPQYRLSLHLTSKLENGVFYWELGDLLSWIPSFPPSTMRIVTSKPENGVFYWELSEFLSRNMRFASETLRWN